MTSLQHLSLWLSDFNIETELKFLLVALEVARTLGRLSKLLLSSPHSAQDTSLLRMQLCRVQSLKHFEEFRGIKVTTGVGGDSNSMVELAVCLSELTSFRVRLAGLCRTPDADWNTAASFQGLTALQCLSVDRLPASNYFASIFGQMAQLTCLGLSLGRAQVQVSRALGCIQN